MHTDGLTGQEEYLLISGIQKFTFCPRQWALAYIEGQWGDNLQTVEGELFHARAHTSGASETRGDLLILRDLRVFSNELGITGACDVVEFHRDAKGVPLQGREGRWRAFPIEYKKGKPKAHDADELQLCAQAICLEEMLCCAIPEGALFYGETRRRQPVVFDENLRQRVGTMTQEMHRYAVRGYTPKTKPHKGCALCSLREVCLPALGKNRSAADWVQKRIAEESP